MTGTFGSGAGGSAPRGQSLLRSFLAARSFPPRPPGYVLNRALHAPQEVAFEPQSKRGPSELAIESLARSSLPNRPFIGGTGREGARSEERAEQRLAPGGGAPCPGKANSSRRRAGGAPCPGTVNVETTQVEPGHSIFCLSLLLCVTVGMRKQLGRSLRRRRFIKLLAGSALTPVVSMLRISTAYAAAAVNCPIYMFHLASAAAVDNVIRANARAGRTPVTVGQLAAMIR